jgi:hypothetical protein
VRKDVAVRVERPDDLLIFSGEWHVVRRGWTVGVEVLRGGEGGDWSVISGTEGVEE